MARKENDFYPTPISILAAIAQHWRPSYRGVWEPCAGDGRVARMCRDAYGQYVIESDIASGEDFFSYWSAPAPTIVTNPPFKHIRQFIDHAFELNVKEMVLVCPERLWACAKGRDQFRRHKPARWVNLDWREDYLGKGGSPDRALAVGIWTSPHSAKCSYEIWTRPTVPPDWQC